MPTPIDRKQKIVALLKGIETGDPNSVKVVNEQTYIQHNPQTLEGGEGLAALFKRLSQTNPSVNIVRIFEDGDFVFGHTEYDFSSRRIGFEVFRFDGDYAVEHWDNIQARLGPNRSGRSMVDGTVAVKDLEKTEVNRKLVKAFIRNVVIPHNMSQIEQYVCENSFVEHSPFSQDGLRELKKTLLQNTSTSEFKINYQTLHRVLAQGNFVLSVCEGFFDGIHSSFYDLFRVNNNKIVEHWDTRETVPEKSEWKNNNGKF
ncbi:hypothetical protein FLL45_17555 [Aliikangiella marina]|uniref:SnoaL-like domain-containing protein n=1 Tax=Aliikangiella marina TaxID=1712262 RepID=A0A545T483_9GAMM|nr:hypothetical protein [Aliikangiella marina]TQV71976.1 hypothetical protein FLL45_17275 [Aliikangiella marina]TQV72029.1 hypothetical protein FLL45_17555 [Aliikangiella marina]